MKKFLFPAIILGVFLMSACTKEVTRNVGQQAQGIVYSIEPEDWAADQDSTVLFAEFDVPELTNAIDDHGAVLVYLSFDGGVWEALPEVYDFYSYTAIHSPGYVSIEARDIDGYTLQPFTGPFNAKIILIDAQKLALHPNVDLTNYEQVKQTFRID